jgi:cytoskeletal protein RodZ
VRADLPVADDEPQGRELRRPGSVNLVEDTQVWGDRVRPIARAGSAVDPLVIDDFEVEPATDPVVGPELVAARTRLGLSVDQLAERTRIRPHVIESIEVDDFAPCGGDFYARGHLRTLARVLGVDATPLLRAYDDRYADAPINPRRVFEAELATGSSGGIRSTRGGPNWSILIAAIMTLVLAWSIARLVMDTPVMLQSPAPSLLNGSEGPSQANPAAPPRVTLKVTSAAETHLKIVNGAGKVVFDADVTYDEIHRIDVRPPVVVSSPDGGAIAVQVNGNDRGTLGKPGTAARKTYRANAG